MDSMETNFKDHQVYEMELCNVCSSQLFFRCQGCNAIYCSAECQKIDSPRHNREHAEKEKILTIDQEYVRVPPRIKANETLAERLKRFGSLSESFSVVEMTPMANEMNVSRESIKSASTITAIKKKLVAPRPLKPSTLVWDVNAGDRCMCTQMKFIQLPLGDQILSLLDGEEIAQGKLHLTLASLDNEIFYDELKTKLDDFMSSNKDKNNYKPIQGELVLVRYSDGDIHRAITVKEEGNDKYSFVLIDWGNKYTTTPKDIWKISEELADTPVVSRTASIVIKSGKSLKTIDGIGTIKKLNEEGCFQGHIEMPVDNKYLVTIDDSWIAFKE